MDITKILGFNIASPETSPNKQAIATPYKNYHEALKSML